MYKLKTKKQDFIIKIISCAAIYLFITNAYAVAPDNFNKAKKVAAHIFEQNPSTLYCGCYYDYKSNQIDLTSCNMQSAQDIPRAHRMEWEHMMPAENFGRQLACWREKICIRKNGKEYKGRQCCEKSDDQYRKMEAELYNLWPSVGLVNQARSNYRYSDFGKNSLLNNNFYGCPIVIDKKLRQIEPRDAAKGIVARANLYMAQKYDIKLSQSQQALFKAWNTQYPPSDWERHWSQQVASIEGSSNSFIN